MRLNAKVREDLEEKVEGYIAEIGIKNQVV